MVLFAVPGAQAGSVLEATPDSYREALQALGPGDRLVLESGEYHHGLPLRGTTGEPGRPVVIEGPAEGEPAVFLARAGANTISLIDVAHVVIRNLVLDGRGEPVAAVRGEPRARFNHHVTLESLRIINHGAAQGIVGIASFAPAWGWVIRGNVIDGAGTGLYLGDSDGSDPFTGGIIEHNVVLNTLGYNMQIKHQQPRESVPGMPRMPQRTVIRHNVFSKAEGGSDGERARPNLLLGHWPLEGPGRDDHYLVYGNLFHMNPHEALMQAEGHVSVYNNLFYNPAGPALRIQPHNDRPRRIEILQNTVVAGGVGVRLSGPAPGYRQRIQGNALFADNPVALENVDDGELEQSANLLASLAASLLRLRNPLPDSPMPSLAWRDGEAAIVREDGPWADHLPGGACDFDGLHRAPGVVGAYGGEDEPVWPLARAPESRWGGPSAMPCSPR